jgi:hypothetical protein
MGQDFHSLTPVRGDPSIYPSSLPLELGKIPEDIFTKVTDFFFLISDENVGHRGGVT